MFLSAWVALMPLCLTSALIGAVVWVWVALLQPNDLLMGFAQSVPFNKIVAIFTLVILIFSKDRKHLFLDTILVSLLLFAAVATVSWAGALAPDAYNDELYQKLVKDIVLTFVLCGVITTRQRLDLVLFTVVLAFGFLGVKEGLISLLTGGGHKILGSPSIGDNNSLATALLMIIPLMVYLTRYTVLTAVRFGLRVAIGLCLVTVVMTFSRGGFLGLLVLAAFFVKNSRNKAASLALVVTAGVAIYALAPDSWFQRLNTIGEAGSDGSFMDRVVAWKISTLIALDHPFFGGGMHALQHPPVWGAYIPLLDRLSFIPTPVPDLPSLAAHSIYFEVLGDLGFTGLGLFLTILIVAWRFCHTTDRLARRTPSLAWAADLSRMMQISLVVYLVTAAALSMAYFEFTYILLALICCCRRLVRQGAERPAALPVKPWQRREPARYYAASR
jgi:putative inorganic carbon (hco3(-)) transporter